MTESPLGLYVHVPFCASKCDFCAFYQKIPGPDEIKRYINGIQAELQTYSKWDRMDTMFWGGGTPSVLTASQLEHLGTIILKHMPKPPKEWTVEVAPATVRLDKLQVLKDLGVTRISMGVQTFDAELLTALGRLHTPDQIYKAYKCIQTVGFDSFNMDLMFSLPGQSIEACLQDITTLATLDPTHISTYCLTFEEDTPLFIKLAKGIYRIDKDKEFEYYIEVWNALEAHGYVHYETSNFSKPGYRCQHNLNTWNMHEWIGLGPSAASQYNNCRYTNIASLEGWLSAIEAGRSAHQEHTQLTSEILAVDSLVFGLRIAEGLDLNTIKYRYPSIDLDIFKPLWLELVKSGHMIQTGTHLQLTQAGKLVADGLGSKILEYSETL